MIGAVRGVGGVLLMEIGGGDIRMLCEAVGWGRRRWGSGGRRIVEAAGCVRR